MAEIMAPNVSELVSAVWSSLPWDMLSNFSFLFTIAKIVGIGFVIYVVFLIIESFLKIRNALRLKELVRILSEINQKMDLLVKKNHKK